MLKQNYEPKIKICGIFREEDVQYLNEARPDYAGFVFAESRRQISEESAFQLRARLDRDIIPVGVFVNAPVAQIARLYERSIISAAQLHGGEDARYIAALKTLCRIPVIKSVKMQTGVPPRIPRHNGIDFLLFDSGNGSGQSFDWTALDGLRGDIQFPWFLAGGITCDNIDAALDCQPYCIDVSSGVETQGIKDRKKILSLVEKVKYANSLNFSRYCNT